MIFLRLKFWIERKFNDGEPGPSECRWALKYYRNPSKHIDRAMRWRAWGWTLEAMSTYLNVPRERSRQLVRKGVRIAWLKYHSQRRNRHQKD